MAEHETKCQPSEHGAPAHEAGLGRAGQKRNRPAAPGGCPPVPSLTRQDQSGITHWGLRPFLGASQGDGLLFPDTLSRPASPSAHPDARAVPAPALHSAQAHE